MALLDFFSREAGQQRRAWLDEQARDLGGLLQYFAGPGVNVESTVRAADMLNPVADVGRAIQSSRDMVAPGRTPAQRAASGLSMATDVASVAAPGVAGGLLNRMGGNAADTATQAADATVDSLLGFVPGRGGAAMDGVLERANQRGPVPTMYSNPVGGGDTPQGIRAYHGSPHDFDRFQMDRIGTGEGAQAYGHGLYFAENEDVARSYRDTVGAQHSGKATNWDDPKSVAEYWAAMYGGKDEGVSYLEGVLDAKRANPKMYSEGPEVTQAAIDHLRSLDELPTSGSMYEVNINANPDDFLDWDAPLSEQPQALRNVIDNADLSHLAPGSRLRRTIEAHRGKPGDWVPDEGATIPEPSGNQIHSALTDFGTSAPENAQLTQQMKQAGIPGIKYRDAGSRGTNEGTRNFVVFDENLIEIVRKYGIAGAAALLGMNASEVEARMNGQAQGGARPGGLLGMTQAEQDELRAYLAQNGT